MNLKERAKEQYAKKFKKAIEEGNSVKVAEFIATRYTQGFLEGFLEGHLKYVDDEKGAEVMQEYKEALREFAKHLK